MTAITHIAGMKVQVGARRRQRCAWCGALLCDYDLTRIAVPEGQDPEPAMWPPEELVVVDGIASYTIPHVDGADLPADACAQLDDEVTG